MERPTHWQKRGDIEGPATVHDFKTLNEPVRMAAQRYILANTCANSRVLDVGCSTGHDAWHCFISGFKGHWVGLDSNQKALEMFRVNMGRWDGRWKLIDGDVELMPDMKKVQIAYSRGIVEHLPGYERVLSEMARVTTSKIMIAFWQPLLIGVDERSYQPDFGYFINKYSRAPLYRYMGSLGFPHNTTVFEHENDEIVVFARRPLRKRP